MLAAASTEEGRILELFDLALRLVKRNGPVPPLLSKHFDVILQQARALADAPENVMGNIYPEAIQLALQLRNLNQLRRAVGDISGLSSVTPKQAAEILSTLETHIETEN